MRAWAGVAASCALVASMAFAAPAAAHSSGTRPGTVSNGLSGTLYYTEFKVGSTGAQPQDNVRSVHFTYDHGQLALAQTQGVAAVPMADGLAWAPHQQLLVGGQIMGALYEVNPATGGYATAVLPEADAYHVTVAPSGTVAYTGGMPGALVQVGLRPFGSDTSIVPLKGGYTAVTQIAFDGTGQAFYTSSDAQGVGSFGTINLSTLTLHPIYSDLAGAHGITYDTYTHDLFLFGNDEILQINPNAPGDPIVSRYTVTLPTVANVNPYYYTLDQGSTDGQGQLFVGANSGTLVFINYAKTGLVGAPGNVVQQTFLDNHVDDVLLGPVSAAGACNQPGQDNGYGPGDHNMSTGWPGMSGNHRSCDPDSNGDVHSNDHNGHGQG